jgi:hypothetical protein
VRFTEVNLFGVCVGDGCFVAAIECAGQASHLNHNVSWMLLAGLDRHTAVSNIEVAEAGRTRTK